MSEAGNGSTGVETTRWPIVSIVVPAHDEEVVIARNLRHLLAGTDPGEFDVVVVPNACADRTAEAAREVFGVRVVDTPVPGKPHALRVGDALCRTFPRIYLDADVELSADSVRALVKACADPGVLACAPVAELSMEGVGRLARRVYRVHEGLVAPGRALAGVGAYVLTEHGHDRVFPIPDLLSDDGWVHTSFAPHERVVVPDARTLVRPARTLAAHLNRRVRVRCGNRQLARLGRAAPEGPLRLRSLLGLVTTHRVSALDAGWYLVVLAMDRTLTWLRLGRTTWASDTSSRRPGPGH